MKIAGVEIIYEQESDSCDQNDLGQTLKASVVDAGGGPYLVIQTQRWAIDGDQIDAFAERLKQAVSMVETHE